MSDVVHTSPDVSIMVVAYHSQDIIAECLDAIAPACTRYTYEVLFVDNGEGETAALVEKHYPHVRIVPGRGNIGFAAANNLLAKSAEAPMLLLVNPDLQLRPGAVDALMDGAQRHAAAAAWGGVTLDRNGVPDVGNSVHIPSIKEMASRLTGRSIARVAHNDGFERDERVEALSGGFVMFSRAIWEEVGGLDERYFLYCEEVDLFYRLGLKGYESWRIGSARAFHDIGHGEIGSPMRELYLSAGTMQFTRLHWEPWKQQVAFAAIWLAYLQRYWVKRLAGLFSSKQKRNATKFKFVATRPQQWRYGYDPTKGLLASLKQSR